MREALRSMGRECAFGHPDISGFESREQPGPIAYETTAAADREMSALRGLPLLQPDS